MRLKVLIDPDGVRALPVDCEILRDALSLREGCACEAPPGHRAHAVCLLLFENPETTILSIQKADHEGYPWRDDVALPGGRIEPDDRDPTEAALRELHEELGIHPSAVEVLGNLGHFQTYNSKADLEVIVARWISRSALHIDPREISQVLELPVEALVDFHKHAGFRLRAENDIGDALIYELPDARIWGVTARILHEFLELLREHGIVE